VDTRLRVVWQRHEVDASARIDFEGLWLIFFHSAGFRRVGQKCKGAARLFTLAFVGGSAILGTLKK